MLSFANHHYNNNNNDNNNNDNSNDNNNNNYNNKNNNNNSNISIYQINELQFSLVLNGSRNSEYPWLFTVCNRSQNGVSFRDISGRRNLCDK